MIDMNSFRNIVYVGGRLKYEEMMDDSVLDNVFLDDDDDDDGFFLINFVDYMFMIEFVLLFEVLLWEGFYLMLFSWE